MWAQGQRDGRALRIGDRDWGRTYRYHQDNHDSSQFWSPPSARARYKLDFHNPSQSGASKAIAALGSPLLYIVNIFGGTSVNGTPEKNYAVPVSAPYLRAPVEPMSVRYGMVQAFDQGKDAARDALDSANPPDGTMYDTRGLGNAQTQGELRYEHAARIRLQRAQGRIGTDEQEQASRQRMLEENPNATDHSTILTNAEHSRRVVAYDVAVGNCWLRPEDWVLFRRLAHWRFIPGKSNDPNSSAKSDDPNDFGSYFKKGKYQDQKLHEYYSLDHMYQHAPDIRDDREGSILGVFA